MVTRFRQNDGEEKRGLAARLRREARGERPEFSAGFQTRLMRRIESLPELVPRPMPALAGSQGAAHARAPSGLPVAGAAAVLLATLLVVTWSSGFGLQSPLAEPAAPSPVAVVASPQPDQQSVPGIESLPLFDEIDEGVRDGVRTLAASLVELPDWASLADFDAVAMLAAAAGP
jgi:hypothetical protein